MLDEDLRRPENLKLLNRRPHRSRRQRRLVTVKETAVIVVMVVLAVLIIIFLNSGDYFQSITGDTQFSATGGKVDNKKVSRAVKFLENMGLHEYLQKEYEKMKGGGHSPY